MQSSRAARKHRIAQRTYVLDKYLKGELAGAHVVMGGMTGRDLIRLRSGELNEAEAMEFTVSKVIEHDLETEDLLSLDYTTLLAIGQAWRDAMADAAIPPGSGNS